MDYDAFIAAVEKDPGHKLLRLSFAYWLDDNGKGDLAYAYRWTVCKNLTIGRIIEWRGIPDSIFARLRSPGFYQGDESHLFDSIEHAYIGLSKALIEVRSDLELK